MVSIFFTCCFVKGLFTIKAKGITISGTALESDLMLDELSTDQIADKAINKKRLIGTRRGNLSLILFFRTLKREYAAKIITDILLYLNSSGIVANVNAMR